MRRQFASWAVFGFLITGGGTLAALSPSAATETEAALVDPVVAVPESEPRYGIRDEAAMVLVGSVLIVLAGAVRRAA